MPVTLAPTMLVPSSAVVAAATLVIAFWAFVGFVTPGMVNVIAWPPVNVPAVNETVKTIRDVPLLRDAVPAAPEAGAINVTVALPEFARAMPAPKSEMTILPLLGTFKYKKGVSVTLMVTAVAPLATLLRVMAG